MNVETVFMYVVLLICIGAISVLISLEIKEKSERKAEKERRELAAADLLMETEWIDLELPPEDELSLEAPADISGSCNGTWKMGFMPGCGYTAQM